MADRFENIYDVTKEGADPTGGSVIDEPVQNLVDDDTLLRFPPGTYSIENLSVVDVSNFGMVGENATLKLNRRNRPLFLQFTRVADVLVDGFTVDITEQNTAARCDMKVTGGTNVIRNYTLDGFVDVASSIKAFTLMVEGGNTSLELDSVDISGGSVDGTAVFVFPQGSFFDSSRKAGSLTFRDCVMKGWGGEGLYASPHAGPLRVIGGEYSNNGIVQIRVGGGNAPERAVVRDVTVRADRIPAYMPQENQTLRGIWLKAGDGALIENCDVTLANLSRSQTPGAVVVKGEFGRATIRDCSITTGSVPRPAIKIKRPTDNYRPRWMPGLDNLPPEWGITLENVTIDGQGPQVPAISIHDRDNCVFHDIDVTLTGEQSSGLSLYNVSDCRLEGGSLTTAGYPIVIRFVDEDDCALDVAGTSIEGTDVRTDGKRISPTGDRGYCIGTDTLSDQKSEASDRLTLTRTVQPDDRNTGTQQKQLYGCWITS